jgi:hypothetical protein
LVGASDAVAACIGDSDQAYEAASVVVAAHHCRGFGFKPMGDSAKATRLVMTLLSGGDLDEGQSGSCDKAFESYLGPMRTVKGTRRTFCHDVRALVRSKPVLRAMLLSE